MLNITTFIYKLLTNLEMMINKCLFGD